MPIPDWAFNENGTNLKSKIRLYRSRLAFTLY